LLFLEGKRIVATFVIAEYNTIVTFLGMICATSQGITGYYAAYIKKRMALIRGNDALFRSHRAFGSAATTFYGLGLFAGLTGFTGAVTRNVPPLELNDPIFVIHSFGSFAIMAIILSKTLISYFNKKFLYTRVKGWLGVATFLAWSFTWITASLAYYLRTLPTNPQHPPPVYLLPYELLPLMLVLPFLLGSLFGGLVVMKAKKIEEAKAARKSKA